MKFSDRSKHAPELVTAAIRENCFKSIVPLNQCAGLQLAQLCHTSERSRDATRIAEEFLLNSRFAPEDFEIPNSIRNYFSDSSQVMISYGGVVAWSGDEAMPLPEPTPIRMTLAEALTRRRSKREYTGDAIRAADISAILQAAGGVTSIVENQLLGGGSVSMRYRTAASGGGLFPVSLHLLALRVTGLAQGVYSYASQDNILIRCDVPVEEILAAVNLPEDQVSATEVAAIMMIVGHPWRSMRKYGARGMRYMFLEAGAISQNIQLAITALGIGGLDFGGFFDTRLNEGLGLDGRTETILHVILVGAA